MNSLIQQKVTWIVQLSTNDRIDSLFAGAMFCADLFRNKPCIFTFILALFHLYLMVVLLDSFGRTWKSRMGSHLWLIRTIWSAESSYNLVSTSCCCTWSGAVHAWCFNIVKKCIGDWSRSQNSKFTRIIKLKLTYLLSVCIFLPPKQISARSARSHSKFSLP